MGSEALVLIKQELVSRSGLPTVYQRADGATL